MKSAKDTVVSSEIDPNFTVIPVRAIKNRSTNDFMLFQKKVIESYNNKELSREEAQLSIEKYWVGALRRAVIEGDVETGSLMAGQSVSFVKEELPLQELLTRLLDSAELHLSETKTLNKLCVV